MDWSSALAAHSGHRDGQSAVVPTHMNNSLSPASTVSAICPEWPVTGQRPSIVGACDPIYGALENPHSRPPNVGNRLMQEALLDTPRITTDLEIHGDAGAALPRLVCIRMMGSALRLCLSKSGPRIAAKTVDLPNSFGPHSTLGPSVKPDRRTYRSKLWNCSSSRDSSFTGRRPHPPMQNVEALQCRGGKRLGRDRAPGAPSPPLGRNRRIPQV